MYVRVKVSDKAKHGVVAPNGLRYGVGDEFTVPENGSEEAKKWMSENSGLVDILEPAQQTGGTGKQPEVKPGDEMMWIGAHYGKASEQPGWVDPTAKPAAKDQHASTSHSTSTSKR